MNWTYIRQYARCRLPKYTESRKWTAISAVVYPNILITTKYHSLIWTRYLVDLRTAYIVDREYRDKLIYYNDEDQPTTIVPNPMKIPKSHIMRWMT